MKKNKIIQHEERYWHIPKFRIGLLILVLLLVLLIYGYSFIFISEWNLHNVSLIFNCNSEECREINASSLGFIPHLFFAHFLISFFFINLCALIKGGFDKLKSYNEDGVIWGLIFGIITGTVFGIIGGLIFGIITGTVFGIIGGLIAGIITELIWGLISELLIREFEK